MERTIVYQITPDDLRIFFDEQFAKKDMDASRNALLKRYENVFVGISEVAAIHQVSGQTVRNYINDGLITPELRTIEGGKHRLRLSHVLTLDFEQLKEQLRARKHK
jgi:AmiR/NasT family two-component response regulator